MKPVVYFSREITRENVSKLYKLLGVTLPRKVAVKVHSGEKGHQNFLRPAFWKPMVDAVQGTVVACNTAYAGTRNATQAHLKPWRNTTGARYALWIFWVQRGPTWSLPFLRVR